MNVQRTACAALAGGLLSALGDGLLKRGFGGDLTRLLAGWRADKARDEGRDTDTATP